MKTHTRLVMFASAALALSFAGARATAPVTKTVEITATDMLRYDVTEIDATPGETIHVVLHNAGTVPKEVMGHNWVLLAAGESPDAYAAAAMTAKAENYEPAALAGKVLAELPIIGPGEKAEVSFKAPTTPGRYTYMCSFPAHCAAGMRGVLVVR